MRIGLYSILENNRQWFIFSLILLALGLGWTFASRSSFNAAENGVPQPAPKEGFSAPDITVNLIGGGQTTLSALHGKVVLVNLWATWCPPCRAEMPAIEKSYQSFKTRGFEVFSVNVTSQDSESAVAPFIKEYGLTFPVTLDRSGEVSSRYALAGLPSSFFIDRKGMIRSVIVGGPMSEALIQSKIEALLKEGE